MQSAAHPTTARSRWIGLAAACGLALSLSAPAAHAQFGGQRSLGAIIGVPVQAIGPIIAANALQNNVNVLHVSQTGIGNFNTQIATLGISQRNQGAGGGGGGLLRAKIPAIFLPQIQQINNNRVIVNQTAVGNGNTQVADVQVAQSNVTAKPGQRFMLVPGQYVTPLVQVNTNVNIVTQLAIGDNNTQVAVVAVDQSNVNVPADAVQPLLQINTNLTVINQIAVGNGNTQVATVNVGQSNG